MKVSTMKQIGITATLLIGIALVYQHRFDLRLEHKDPPPGYGIACDGRGHFKFMRPDGGKSVATESSRQSAINWAWHTFKSERYFDEEIAKLKQEHPDSDFHICEQEKP